MNWGPFLRAVRQRRRNSIVLLVFVFTFLGYNIFLPFCATFCVFGLFFLKTLVCRLGQSSASHRRCRVKQQRCVCLMFQLSFKCMNDKAISTVRLHKDPTLASTSRTCVFTHTGTQTHTRTRAHTVAHILWSCTESHGGFMWAAVSKKIYYFHMVLILSLAGQSSTGSVWVCVSFSP